MFAGLPDIMEHWLQSHWTRRGRISVSPDGTGNPVTGSYENRQNSNHIPCLPVYRTLWNIGSNPIERAGVELVLVQMESVIR